MQKILIIGAGVIGLSLAYEISKKNKFKVFIIEKKKSFGLESSSKNSEVIHSGVYYKKNSLKAKLCVQGKKLIYSFCKKNNISYKKTQKLFIGNTNKDYKLILRLYKNSIKNNVKNVKIINQKNIKKIEPHLKARYALLSKSSGIFDVKQFMYKLFLICKKKNVKILYKKNIDRGFYKNGKFVFPKINNEKFDFVINAAGLGAIKIAKKTFSKQTFPSDKPIIGLYFKTNQNIGVQKIIYSAMEPAKNMERVDITPLISGGYLLGPSVEKNDNINLKKTKIKFDKFLRKIHNFIDTKKIFFFKKGVRPKINTTTKSYTDFYIKKVNKYNWVNLFGIESPGLTSSLAIAKYVVRKFL